VIESRAGTKLDEQAVLLAYHWDAASEPGRAIEWHERAGEWTIMSDPQASLRHWQRVRELVAEHPADPETLSLGARTCAHILDIGWQLGVSEEETTRAFEDGKALAERAGDAALLAKLTGAFASLRGIDLGFASDYVAYAREAVRLADKTGDAVLQSAMNMRLVHGYFLSGQHAQVCDLSAKALSQMPSEEAFAGRVSPAPAILLFRGLALALTGGDPDESRRCLLESEELSAARGLAEMEIAVHGNLAHLFTLTGDRDTARTHARAATVRAEPLNTGLAQSWTQFSLGRVHRADGDIEEAIESFEEGLRIAQEGRLSGFLIGSALAGLADALLERGNVKGAAQRAQVAVEFDRSHGLAWDLSPWLTWSRTLIAGGEEAGARQALEETRQLIESTGARLFEPHLHECRAAFAHRFDAG
jgi:adenylate cyclase